VPPEIFSVPDAPVFMPRFMVETVRVPEFDSLSRPPMAMCPILFFHDSIRFQQ